jgi:hypothetical protein
MMSDFSNSNLKRAFSQKELLILDPLMLVYTKKAQKILSKLSFL